MKYVRRDHLVKTRYMFIELQVNFFMMYLCLFQSSCAYLATDKVQQTE